MRRLIIGLLFFSSYGLVAFGCGLPEDDDSPVVIDEDTSEYRPPPSDDDDPDTGGDDTDAGMEEDVFSPDTRVDDAGTDGGGTNDAGTDDGGTRDAGDPPDDGGQDATSPEAEEVDPMCVDGQYSEPLPDDDADISSAKQNYSSADVKDFVRTALGARYPVGKWLVNNALDKGRRDCVEQFLRDDSSADSVLQGLSTVVHECGHIFDLNVAPQRGSSYKITPDLSLSCSGGDTTSRGGNTFARSRLRNDDYQDEYPRCQSRDEQGCDSYAYIYLDGDPDDDEFQGGDQGFNSVLEEALQYTNSLATTYAFRDAYPERRRTSGLDGILTFLWYIERYLHLARTEYPDAYSFIKNNDCWRRAILTIWGRAWLLIDAAEQYDRLGINDEKLFELVRTPELLEEIDRIRNAHGCQ